MMFRDSFAFLSNFYELQEGRMIETEVGPVPTSEHAYQIGKALEAGLPNIARQIVAWRMPGMAKRLGKKLPLLPEDIRLEVMMNALQEKFRIGTPEAAKLLATGNLHLVEENWWGDTFWGTCRGIGRNMLGHLLMHQRQALGGTGETP